MPDTPDITTRLGLHKPHNTSEHFGAIFPTDYAGDIQAIDDAVQIKLLAAAGKIPVYDESGYLVSSGIAPDDIEAGLIASILTTQGMILYRGASALAALSASTSGKCLLTKGVGANPDWGYLSHGDLLNKNIDDHPQYVKHSLTEAISDFLVGSGSGTFIKKTLAETKAILGLDYVTALAAVVSVVSSKIGIGTTTTARAKLEVQSGDANTDADPSKELTVVGPDVASAMAGNIEIETNNVPAADLGGSIAFGGRYITASTGKAIWAAIKGCKINSTSGEYGGYLSLRTRAQGGILTEVMRLVNGKVGIGRIPTDYALEVQGDIYATGNYRNMPNRPIEIVVQGLPGFSVDHHCEYNATLLRATIIAHTAGTIQVSIYKCTYAQFDDGSAHPVIGDSIVASAPIKIATTGVKAQDSTLTGWTKTLSEGDILRFVVDNVSGISQATISLKVTPTA